MSACSRFDAREARRCAFSIAASAGAFAFGSIGTLMLGPSAHASPQKHIAHWGSSRCALRNARSASSWLKPHASR
jgi:hypothetical protein